MVQDTHENFLMVLSVPRFSDLERDYACKEYQQLSAFVATMQLLVN